MEDMRHMDYLETVTAADVRVLREKEATYQGSWKQAGGRSAWFMLRRNMDRLLNMMMKPPDVHGFSIEDYDDMIEQAKNDEVTMDVSIARYMRDCYVAENVFAKIRENSSGEDGTMLAVMRDLRRYCILVEAEMMARGVVTGIPPETLERYREVGIDVHNPNPDGSDYHLMNAIDEQMRPGTPEDGGQHASTWPWVATRSQIRRLSSPIVGDLLYVNHSEMRCFLEPGLQYSSELRGILKDSIWEGCYELVETKGLKSMWYVLRIADVPREERSLWPVLNREYNAKEFTLMTWGQSLYDWHGGPVKYIIRPEHEAWTENGEE